MIRYCKKCESTKPTSDFYKSQKSECKDCVKLRVKAREKELMKDPEHVAKERKRGRDKYHRLGYKATANQSRTSETSNKSRVTYPEKYRAYKISQRIKNPKGFEKHHWNYNEGFEKDIIFLIKINHSKLHRYCIYDQERMMYRKLNGELIDTRKKCENYIEEIKDLD